MTPEERVIQAFRAAYPPRVRVEDVTPLVSRNFPAPSSVAYNLSDDQVAQLPAVCADCGASTIGAWQTGIGGRRFRAPSIHNASPGLGECPGSFKPAKLGGNIERTTQ